MAYVPADGWYLLAARVAADAVRSGDTAEIEAWRRWARERTEIEHRSWRAVPIGYMTPIIQWGKSELDEARRRRKRRKASQRPKPARNRPKNRPKAG